MNFTRKFIVFFNIFLLFYVFREFIGKNFFPFLKVRAKLIVEDGQIVSDRFPQHHPACEAKPLEQVLIQQVDRTSRREVKDGYLLPQDAYRKGKN